VTGKDPVLSAKGTKRPIGTPVQTGATQMATDEERPDAGAKVVLVSLPAGLLYGLPEEDQKAIAAIVGIPVSLAGYDEDGRAELEFAGLRRGQHHTIWVDAKFIRVCR
jgi:hypothetical protein